MSDRSRPAFGRYADLKLETLDAGREGREIGNHIRHGQSRHTDGNHFVAVDVIAVLDCKGSQIRLRKSAAHNVESRFADCAETGRS